MKFIKNLFRFIKQFQSKKPKNIITTTGWRSYPWGEEHFYKKEVMR